MNNIDDVVVRNLRTVVPVAWGSIVSFLIQFIASDISEPINDALRSEPVGVAVTALTIWVWYLIWSKVSHLIPDWLTKLVMGSEKEPTYL